jgi:plasmid stability protein
MRWRLFSAFASFKRTRTILIGNVPDDVHRALSARAAASGMSLSEYALSELERVARRPSVADVLAGARPGGAEHGAIVAAVRTGRDRG